MTELAPGVAVEILTDELAASSYGPGFGDVAVVEAVHVVRYLDAMAPRYLLAEVRFLIGVYTDGSPAWSRLFGYYPHELAPLRDRP